MSDKHIELRRDIARRAGENERLFGTPSAEALRIAAASDDLDELLETRDAAVAEPRRQREQRLLCLASACIYGLMVLGTGWGLYSVFADVIARDEAARTAGQRHLDSLLAEREVIVKELARDDR